MDAVVAIVAKSQEPPSSKIPPKQTLPTSRSQQPPRLKVPKGVGGKRKASSISTAPRPPAVKTTCTCNTTLSAPFQETCEFCQENSSGPSEEVLNEASTPKSFMSTTTDESETGMQQMQRKVSELFQEKESFETKCKLLEKQNKELKEKLRKMAGVAAEGENFFKKLKRTSAAI